MSTDPSARTHRLIKILIAVWFVAVFIMLHRSFPEFWRDAQDEFEEGERLRASGQPAEAVPWVEKAISMDPDNPGYHVALANLQLELGQKELASATFGKALEMHPGNTEALFGLLTISMEREQPAKARGYAERLAKQKLGDVLLLRRARACAQLGMHEQALADINSLLTAYPETVGLLLEAAKLESAQGRFDRAAKHYARLVEVAANEGDQREAILGKAVSLRAMGEPALAYEAYQQLDGAGTLRPRAELAAQLKDYPVAEKLYGVLIDSDPGNITNVLVLATLYEAQSKYEQAVELLTRRQEILAALDPHLVLRQADLYRWAERPESAIEAYREYLENAGDGVRQARAREGLTRALIDLGQGEAALAALEPLLEVDAGNPTYRLLAARAAALAGDAPQVVAHLEGIAEQRELSGVESLWLAGQYREASQSAKALAAYNTAYAKMGKKTPVDVLIALGDLRADVAAWSGALEAYGLARTLDEGRTLDLRIARAAQHVEGKEGQAAERYLAYGAARPDDGAAQWEVVDYLCKIKRYPQALTLLEGLSERIPDQGANAAARMGNIYRWQRQYGQAIGAYRVAIAAATSLEHSLPARLGLLSCLVDEGLGADADELATQLARELPANVELLVLRARAADLVNAPARTAEYLESLAGIQPLSVAEQAWQAGRYRACGRSADALRAYNSLFSDHLPELPDEVIEAVGDLRYDFRDWVGASAAYAAVRGKDADPRIQLKLARTVQKQDPKATAIVKAYRDYLEAYPEDWDVTLEAARVLVNLDALEPARDLYLRYIEARGAEGLGVELARALLAAGEFGKAEEWARKAMEENPDDWRATLALAQSLHLQGHSWKAAKIIDEHEEEFSRHKDGLEWLGLVAMARDHHLKAFRIFDELVQDPETARREHWLWRGRSAMRLRNFGVADESFEAAAAMDRLSPEELKAARDKAEKAVKRIQNAEQSAVDPPKSDSE